MKQSTYEAYLDFMNYLDMFGGYIHVELEPHVPPSSYVLSTFITSGPTGGCETLLDFDTIKDA